MLYPSISPVVVSVIKAIESIAISLRTQWISLEIFGTQTSVLSKRKLSYAILCFLKSLSRFLDCTSMKKKKIITAKHTGQKHGKYVLFLSIFQLLDKFTLALWTHLACFESTVLSSTSFLQPQNRPSRHVHTMQCRVLAADMLTTE